MSFAGIKIGHATDAAAHTGCSVFLCPEGTVGSIDVRGSGPGTREAALLATERPERPIHAVMLSGGSAFGLAAADGAMRYLAEQDIGYATPVRPIPIVPAAIVYDLFLGGGKRLPDASLGYDACLAAKDSEPAQGNVGVGTGVTVGKWAGPGHMMKGGFGIARLEAEGVEVAAAAVVNCIGDVVNDDGSVLAGAYAQSGEWMVERDPLRRYPRQEPPVLGTSTTLVVVATTASLNRVGCHRLAQRVHDGIALAVRPVHTTHDGDAAFVLATGIDALRLGSLTSAREARTFDMLGNMAVSATAEAIRNAVRHAVSVAGVRGLAG